MAVVFNSKAMHTVDVGHQAAQAERQAAVDAIHGAVVGGFWRDPIGSYYVPINMNVKITSVQHDLDRSIADPQFVMLILAIFATLGVVLASVGLFGVISYTVGQRTREIGIRMTLGATRALIARLVVGDGLRLVAAGIVLGLAGATAATRLVQTMLYGVSRFDATSFALAAAGVLVMSLIACAVPMLEATSVDAAITLRGE